MPVTPLDNTRISHPNLIPDILKFFYWREAPIVNEAIQSRSVSQFMTHVSKSGQSQLLPSIIVQVCRRLTSMGWLMESASYGWDGISNVYSSSIRDLDSLENPGVVRMLNCGVYGFPAVYDAYYESVIPLVAFDKTGDQQIGTCFANSPSSVITAGHCVLDANALSVRGASTSDLTAAKFFVHPNDALDLAFIYFETPVFANLAAIPLAQTEAVILDEVIALGYPNLPGFLPSLAAEGANISGRLTVTRGRISSKSTEIFAKASLLLVTARVRGGFSGGPVLDTLGQAVGVVSREPAAQSAGNVGQVYDQLGYGTAIPSSSALELVLGAAAGSIEPIDTSDLSFRDFE